MELIDPYADNFKAESWAASDEAAKSPWQQFEYAATTVDDGVGLDIWDEFVLGLLDAGELLLDNVSVKERPSSSLPIELLQNGDFENDKIGQTPNLWRLVGNHGIHGRSVVQQDPDDPNNHVLRITATGPIRDVDNHIETTLNADTRAAPALPENIS